MLSSSNRCPQDTDVFELHRQEMEKAAAEARVIYEKEHPESEGKDLKYDPLKEMEEGQLRGTSISVDSHGNSPEMTTKSSCF